MAVTRSTMAHDTKHSERDAHNFHSRSMGLMRRHFGGAGRKLRGIDGHNVLDAWRQLRLRYKSTMPEKGQATKNAGWLASFEPLQKTEWAPLEPPFWDRNGAFGNFGVPNSKNGPPKMGPFDSVWAAFLIRKKHGIFCKYEQQMKHPTLRPKIHAV